MVPVRSALADPEAYVAPTFSHFVEYHHTLGPEVGALCAELNYAPGPEQQMLLDQIFGEDKDNHPSCFEAGVICNRQNLKTALLKMCAIGWLFITDQKKIIWSSHDFKTTKDMCREIDQLVRSVPWLGKLLKPTRWSPQDMCIETLSGHRLEFKARTKSGGRGLTGDKVILDEGFALTEEQMGSLMPILGPQRDSQVVYASSAGMADSDVLRDVRDRGREGVTPDMVYAEWCAVLGSCADPHCEHAKPGSKGYREGCAFDDREQWKQANPVMNRPRRANGTGLTELDFERDRRALSPHQFGRERLGIWDEPGLDDVFGPGNWEACAGDVPESFADAGINLAGIGVSVSGDLAYASILGAGKLDDGRVVVEPLAHEQGTDWVTNFVKELLDAQSVPVVMDERSPGAFLIADLKEVGWQNFHTTKTREYLDACSGIYSRVVNHELLHGDWRDLNMSVAAGVKRQLGDRWAWERKIGDSSELDAMTLAVWATDNLNASRSIYED